MADEQDKTTEIPAQQGIPEVGYCKPPAATQFKPGQSGNPKGRPSAGACLREWINQMEDWPGHKLLAVMDDPDAGASKTTAARIWLDARSRATNAAGSPIAGAEFDRIMDRTEGKPKQSVELTNDGAPRSDADRKAAADSIVADILAALGGKPAGGAGGGGATPTPADQ